MYDDTIDVSNKIITSEDLLEIFEKINSEIHRIQELGMSENVRNANIDYSNQSWSYKNVNANFKCTLNFYDSTNVTVDNYESFINLYNTRLREIKDMWVRCSIYYSAGVGYHTNSISNSIQMYIYENKMNITSNLSSTDNTLDEVYQLIKEKVLNAPDRYDEVIRKKNSISNKVGFAIGMIPSIIIFSLFAYFSIVRQIYSNTYVIYPILVLLLAFLAGNTLFRGKIDNLYSSIEPNKKYMGYDRANSKNIYKDDLNEFTSKSEILIGKNVDNLNIRKEILSINEKYSKYIPIELVILLILSIIMVIIGKLI